MKKLILLFSIELLALSCLYAQVAYKDYKGRFVIDNAAMLRKSTKTPAEVAATIDPVTKAVVAHTEQDPMNERVSPKFEVSPVNDTSVRVDWAGSVVMCIAKDGGEKGWRLPTQRECMLIVIMQRQLEALAGFSVLAGDGYLATSLFSSTVYSANQANGCFEMSFWSDERGWEVASTAKNSVTDLVRCVRDITN